MDELMKPLSWYKSLSLPKNRRQYGYFLIEGKRAVDQVLTFHRDSVEEILCTDGALPSIPLSNDVPVRTLPDVNIKSICASKTPQGIAALVRIPADVYTSKIPERPSLNNSVLLLEHIQDPGNAGTLIRTAAAFGVGGVILSDQCADPFSPKAVQSTAGSLLSVWIRKTDRYMPMIDELKDSGYKLIAADLDGSESHGFINGIGKHILALGSEGPGLTAGMLDRCDYSIRIPIAESGAESLNVASSGAICMFMLRRSR
ncbi:MAG: RNA methyltransferase [Chitinispirillia bacterium]|nr:RNA methyltransferase [Chitinispirillia bacterium]MCL2242338.1 RNA methyltransferase [Chitinispirillia bacterium]